MTLMNNMYLLRLVNTKILILDAIMFPA